MTRSRRLRLLGAGTLLGTLFIVAVAPAIGGTGVGAVFNLGKTNAVNRTSTLTGRATGRILQVTNSGSGTALQLTTKTTVPPMKVNSSVKVSNLNADKLDGRDSTGFMAAGAHPDANTLDGIDSTGFMAAGAHPDANTLDGIDSTGFLRPGGQILISAGNSAWVPFSSSDPVTQVYFSNSAQWTRSPGGSGFLSISPDLPTAMFGKMVQLEGVELCYGTGTSTSLTYVEINTVQSSAGEASRSLVFSDPTTYTSSACHLYKLSTPAPLGSEKGANLFIQVNWAVDGAVFTIDRTTFVLGMTATPAPAPAAVVIAGEPVKPGAKSATDAPSR